ncbi:hypothetical protein DFH28DRAFT_930773 [Melampsora americana]|nr:hypothetical protein DFH28DRAFT_930773 [Melampsora americana]
MIEVLKNIGYEREKGSLLTDTSRELMDVNMRFSHQNHLTDNQEDAWISSLLEDPEITNTLNFFPLQEINVRNYQPPPHPNDTIEELQNAPPQFKYSTAHSKHIIPHSHTEIINHDADIGKCFPISPNIGGMSWIGEDVGQLSTDDFPISDFEISNHSIHQEGELDQVARLPGNIDMDHVGSTHSSRPSNILTPSILSIPQPNIPTGLQHLPHLNILDDSMNHRSHGIVQDQLIGSTNHFSPYLPSKQTDPQSFWYNIPERHTSSNLVIVSPRPAMSHPGGLMISESSKHPHLPKDTVIDPEKKTPDSVHADQLTDSLDNIWDHHIYNTMRLESLPIDTHQSSGQGGPQFSEGDFDEAYCLDLDELFDQDHDPNLMSHSIIADKFNKLEIRSDHDNSWGREQGEGSQSPFKAHNELHVYKDLITQKNLIRNLHSFEDPVIQNKRQKCQIEKVSIMGVATASTSDQPFYPNNNKACSGVDVQGVSSKDLLLTNIDNQIAPFSKETNDFLDPDTLQLRNSSKETSVFWDNDMIEGKTQDIPGAAPKKPKKCKSVTPHKETNMYRNQLRSPFDLIVEKHVTTFMTQLEEYLKTERDLSQRLPGFKSFLKMRITLMTHEFLLWLVKVKLCYDCEREDINETLAEGYRWLKDMWKTIPFKTIKLEDDSTISEVGRAYADTNINCTVRNYLLSRLINRNIFALSQHHLIAYVILHWTKQFRPKWFEIVKTLPDFGSGYITDYKPNNQQVKCFLAYIQDRICDIEKDKQFTIS